MHLVCRPQHREPCPEAGTVEQQRRAKMSTETILTDPRDVVRLGLLLQTTFHHVPTQQALRGHTWAIKCCMHFVQGNVCPPNCTDSHLEEDKATKTQHFPFHGAIEVSFLPEVHGGENVRKSNQPPPHSMTPLHVKDKLKLWQRHVVVHSRKTVTEVLNLIQFCLKLKKCCIEEKKGAYILNSGNCWYFENSASHSASVRGGFISLTRCQSTIERPDSVNLISSTEISV